MTDERTKEEPRRAMSGWMSALLFFGAVALVVVAVAWIYPKASPDAAKASTTTSTSIAATTTVGDVDVTLPASPDTDEPVADAAQVILPSVVHIQTRAGVGSGVVYDENGLIITAAHVVAGSDTVRIRFTDGDQVDGTVLGAASEVDIAVIRVERSDLIAATFAREKPRVGQMAIAVGSPWGLESTVTAGIISAVDQTNCSFDTCSSMVQTDAAINPGNSGGALVDRNGRVVGINVSIFTDTGVNEGVGFAVPADIAVTYADAIVSGQPIETAFLGVQGEDVETEGQAGTRITVVVSQSAAEAAGVQVDDVVIGLDGVPIFSWPDLIAQVRAHRPGERVDILVLRGDEEITLHATLDVRTEDVG